MDCIFCKIIAGEIPSKCIYEDEYSYAFEDLAPQAPVHFLIVPKAHMASASDVTAENSVHIGKVYEAIAKITKEQGLEDYRVVTNCGEGAGQTVFHLHFHVLAGRSLAWPPG